MKLTDVERSTVAGSNKSTAVQEQCDEPANEQDECECETIHVPEPPANYRDWKKLYFGGVSSDPHIEDAKRAYLKRLSLWRKICIDLRLRANHLPWNKRKMLNLAKYEGETQP